MQIDTQTALLQALSRIEKLARGSKLRRFLANPFRYVNAIVYWRLVYPVRKKGKFAEATTFFGLPVKVVLPSATEIFLFGAKTHDSEIRLTKFLIKNLLPGSVFADVGAHFGYFSLLASHLSGPTGKVFSFEASGSTFEILKKNTSGIGNISVFHRAASDVNQPLTFHEFPVLFSEYNSLILPEEEHAAWLQNNPPVKTVVEGWRLDDFFTKEKLVPQFIKIDVEGAELQVLKGMEQTMRLHSPVLLMEYLLDKSQHQSHEAAVHFAQNLGYRIFLIDGEGGLQPCVNLDKELTERHLHSDNIILKK